MLGPEQQKELEISIFNYLQEKNYEKSAESLKNESSFLRELNIAKNEDRVLERKWFTIVKLQSRILELEKRLAQSEEIIAKSVRNLNFPDLGNEANKDALDTPVVKMTKVYKGHKDLVTCVALHSSEPFFASGSADSTIRLVDYELQNSIVILKGHTHAVNCLSWAKEELISGSSDMSIKIWKSGNKTNSFDLNEFYCHKTLLGHEHIVSGLVSIEDSEYTISVSRDKVIKLWERTSGFCKKTISHTHDDWIRCCDANKKYLVTSGNDKKVFVFDLAHIISSEKQSEHHLYHVNDFQVHENFVDSIRIYKHGKLNEDENVAITASRDKTIGVWSLPSGNCIVRLMGHENWVKDIQILETYNLLLSVGDDKSLRIWDLKRKKQVYVEANSHDHFVSCLSVAPEYRIVLTGSVDKTTKIWKILNSNSAEFMKTALSL